MKNEAEVLFTRTTQRNLTPTRQLMKGLPHDLREASSQGTKQG